MPYAICLDKQRAYHPEYCGRIEGYKVLLEVLSDPTHEEYADFLDWAGGEIKPEEFNPKEVKFDDPKERSKLLLAA